MRRGVELLLAVMLVSASCGEPAEDEPAPPTSVQAATTVATPASTESTSTTTSVVTTTSITAGSLPVAGKAAEIRSVLISGRDMAAAATYRDRPITYAAPGADATQVGRVQYKADATLDVYYPPTYAFDDLLPAVVFVNAWSTTQDTGKILFLPDGTPMGEELGMDDYQNSDSFISMGNFVAASGLVGVVYGTRADPAQDLDEAMTWLTDHADDLGVDRSRIATWMWSAHTLTGLRAVMEEGEWQDGLAAAVVYYEWMPYEDVRDGPAVHLVQALEDLEFFLDSQARFVSAAQELGAGVDVVEVQGPHEFDREPGYEDLTVEALNTTLDYLLARFDGES